MTTLSLPPTALGASIDNRAVKRAREYAEAAHADNTRRAYSSGFQHFNAWCDARGMQALPAAPQTVVLYVTDLAAIAKLATIRQRLAAIAHVHRENGLESPVGHGSVQRVVRGITRTIGASQARKAALTLDALRAMLLAFGATD